MANWAGVKVSTWPVGVGVDSGLRMLAWGCRAATPGGSGPSLHPPFVPSGGVRTNVIQLRKQNAKDEYPTRAREGGHVLVPREAKKKVSRKRGNRNFIVLLVYVPNIRPSHHLHHQQFRHNLVSSMTRA